MKSTKEILEMLVRELADHLDDVKAINQKPVYYNEKLGDASFLLAGLLGLLLKSNETGWDVGKWMDDSLVSKITITDTIVEIEGIMIWGETETTEQWTAPFSFKIALRNEEINSGEFTFSFSDLENPEITYENFSKNRDYWAGVNKKWKYIFNSNEAIL